MALCLLVPVAASASVPCAERRLRARPLLVATACRAREAERDNAREILNAFDLSGVGAPVRIGSWLIHPKGFAFRIPDGYRYQGQYKGADIMLISTNGGSDATRSSIAVTLSQAHDLSQMTRLRIERAYPSSFPYFELCHYAADTLLDLPCVRITFVSSQSPQLLFRQSLLNKRDMGLIITLQTENTLPRVAEGIAAYAQFCDSLMFSGEA